MRSEFIKIHKEFFFSCKRIKTKGCEWNVSRCKEVYIRNKIWRCNKQRRTKTRIDCRDKQIVEKCLFEIMEMWKIFDSETMKIEKNKAWKQREKVDKHAKWSIFYVAFFSFAMKCCCADLKLRFPITSLKIEWRLTFANENL